MPLWAIIFFIILMNSLQDEIGEPCKDFILEAGDMIYLPRGTIHQVSFSYLDQCLSNRVSRHICVSPKFLPSVATEIQYFYLRWISLYNYNLANFFFGLFLFQSEHIISSICRRTNQCFVFLVHLFCFCVIYNIIHNLCFKLLSRK